MTYVTEECGNEKRYSIVRRLSVKLAASVILGAETLSYRDGKANCADMFMAYSASLSATCYNVRLHERDMKGEAA